MRSAFFAVMLFLGMAAVGQAKTADPRDSIILESKTVAPGLSGSAVFTMKVYLTNKDTVAILTLALRESTTTGGAYALLDSTGSGEPDGWTRADCLTFLKKTLSSNPAEDFSGYDGKSPDRFLIAASFSPTSANPVRGSEPPNAARSAIWELKFMGSSKAPGKVRFDAVRLAQASGLTIVRQRGQMVEDIAVNFLPGVLSVEAPKKGGLVPGFEKPSGYGLRLHNEEFFPMKSTAMGNFHGAEHSGRASSAEAVYREEEFPC